VCHLSFTKGSWVKVHSHTLQLVPSVLNQKHGIEIQHIIKPLETTYFFIFKHKKYIYAIIMSVKAGFNLVTDSVSPLGGRESKSQNIEVSAPPGHFLDISSAKVVYTKQIGDEAYCRLERTRQDSSGRVVNAVYYAHTRSRNALGCRGHVDGWVEIKILPV
jgi:hypothetical protein